MPESLNFLSPEQKHEQETKKQLAQEGGIVHTAHPDPETEEQKQFVNILGVEIETNASKEDIQTIKDELILSELDQEMLRTIAESYKANQAVMLEGDPGSGKTFLLKQFVKMIHGKDAPTLEIVCSPGMTELDILGQ
jgi:MoxR-like ATPase